MADFAAWMTVTGDANDGKHNATPNLTFWCWNPDSFDTGNLYAKSGPEAGKVAPPPTPHHPCGPKLWGYLC